MKFDSIIFLYGIIPELIEYKIVQFLLVLFFVWCITQEPCQNSNCWFDNIKNNHLRKFVSGVYVFSAFVFIIILVFTILFGMADFISFLFSNSGKW